VCERERERERHHYGLHTLKLEKSDSIFSYFFVINNDYVQTLHVRQCVQRKLRSCCKKSVLTVEPDNLNRPALEVDK
jgi:hypothetical protein